MSMVKVKVKVKLSHYRRGQALRFPGGWHSQISIKLAHEGGSVVNLMHWPPLHPGNIPGTHFCQRLSRLHGHRAVVRVMSMKNNVYVVYTNKNLSSDMTIWGIATVHLFVLIRVLPLRNSVPEQYLAVLTEGYSCLVIYFRSFIIHIHFPIWRNILCPAETTSTNKLIN
jgi:hypothetical protein